MSNVRTERKKVVAVIIIVTTLVGKALRTCATCALRTCAMPHGATATSRREPSTVESTGDDFASTDEVKIYKDEGEDEQRSSENLSEDKLGLVTETEEVNDVCKVFFFQLQIFREFILCY